MFVPVVCSLSRLLVHITSFTYFSWRVLPKQAQKVISRSQQKPISFVNLQDSFRIVGNLGCRKMRAKPEAAPFAFTCEVRILRGESCTIKVTKCGRCCSEAGVHDFNQDQVYFAEVVVYRAGLSKFKSQLIYVRRSEMFCRSLMLDR